MWFLIDFFGICEGAGQQHLTTAHSQFSESQASLYILVVLYVQNYIQRVQTPSVQSFYTRSLIHRIWIIPTGCDL